MSDTRFPRNLFFAIFTAGILQCVHDLPLLPNRLASHFAASGMANGWMTKSQFFITYIVVILPSIALEFWMPSRITKKSGAGLNLPNKEYWLAPERRTETLAYFKGFFSWYGCAFLLLEVFAMGMALRANFAVPARLPVIPIASAIVAFVVFNIAGVIAMYRRFSKPQQ
ncbi:MAG TPA: hypothetical protein VNI36_09420 [Candidatus Dormibacteraeota bacterium]|nr:hypothetical protein [Candidatus Dormibacteraeota bacterium]